MKFSQNIAVKEKIASYEFLKIEPFDISKRHTKPHRHNKYLELVFFLKGSGYHHLDTKPYQIMPPIAFLIHQEQVHHWSIDSVPEGYVVIIKESFLENVSDNVIRLQLNALRDLKKIDVDKKDSVLPLLFRALCAEMKQSQPNREVIESGLKAILAKLIDYTGNEISTSHTGIEQKFLELLSQNLKNSVTYYAEQLHTSSQNLNAVCKKCFQKSASDVIAEFIINEVKRQLLYTTKSVSDIAFDLQFKDSSNFTKVFKRHTGFTPLEYKKR